MRLEKYKYQVTKQKLMDIISKMPVSESLPNRNQLSKQCGVARVTLERAISELIGEGILISIDGRGTYKADAAPEIRKETAASTRLDEYTWALLVYSVTKGTAPCIVRGVEDFANERGISLIICNTDNDPQKEIEYLKRLHTQNVSGIVVIPSTHSGPNWTIFDALGKKGVSVVACSRQVPGHDYPGAFQNFFQAGFMATQHLFQQGCRRVAYLATSHYSTIEDRRQGYLAALDLYNSQHPGETPHEEMGLLHPACPEEVEGLFEDFLREHPETDGIYVLNDRLALQLYTVMQRMNLVPGRDIRIIASDDSGFSASLCVPLSTIDSPAYKMGALAAEQLMNLRSGVHETDCKHVVLSGELNARASSLGK